MRRWAYRLWFGAHYRVECTTKMCEREKLTAKYETCDALANAPHTLRNIRAKLLNDTCEIVTHDSAILGRLDHTSESLPCIRSDNIRNAGYQRVQ
jgi:hypothetical protein